MNFSKAPLADRYRPKSFDDFLGQEHLSAKNSFLRQSIEADNFGSMIFWGPPGSGKTTLANIIANNTKRNFVFFSAVLQGVKDIKILVEKAQADIEAGLANYILFVDEIHRFNKGQQDALLPHVEKGTIILIGATTENPSFEINSALLSRCQVYVLDYLKEEHILTLIDKVLVDEERGLGKFKIEICDEAKSYLCNIANGDLRTVLNTLEQAVFNLEVGSTLSLALLKEVLSSRKISFDKAGEEHYNLISALHKSMRGSDVQASLYWLSRMIEGGCDPLYIARRLMRFASEDVGLADPNALVQAVACKEAVHFLGYPECNTALAQCVVYLSSSPKSNAVYTAIKSAAKAVKESINEPVPLNIRNAPTKLMKNLDYGKGYKYDQDSENKFSGQDFLPKTLLGKVFYKPGTYGFEKDISKRIEYWQKLKKLIKINEKTEK